MAPLDSIDQRRRLCHIHTGQASDVRSPPIDLPTSMWPFTVASFALACAPLVHSATYRAFSPPDTIVLAYPAPNATAGDPLRLGFDGAGASIPEDYYGFTFTTEISLVLPNGTTLRDVASLPFVPPGSAPKCGKGSAPGPSPNSDIRYAVTTQPVTDVGQCVPAPCPSHSTLTARWRRYMVVWNLTYGTANSSLVVVDDTSCDLSRLTYQTWLLWRYFTVLPRTAGTSSEGTQAPPITKVTQTLVPSPTGAVLLKNSANLSLVWMPLLLLSVAWSILSEL